MNGGSLSRTLATITAITPASTAIGSNQPKSGRPTNLAKDRLCGRKQRVHLERAPKVVRERYLVLFAPNHITDEEPERFVQPDIARRQDSRRKYD